MAVTARRMNAATTSDLLFDATTAKIKGQRGNAKGRAAIRVYVYIDGTPYTYQQLAERLGVAVSTAEGRVKKARKTEGPMTWAKLEPSRETKTTQRTTEEGPQAERAMAGDQGQDEGATP